MSKRDYYEILGVEKTADDKVLKSAYRKKAMEFHPDRNPNNPEAETKFKEVNEAYEILSDAQKKAAYDRYGHAAFENGRGGAGAGQEGFGDINDIFNQFFGGGGRGRGGPQKGRDRQARINMTLEEAFHGKKYDIKLNRLIHCTGCKGSGADEGSSVVNCSTCGGHGRVRMSQGFFQIEQTCPRCKGKGKTIEKPCRKCHGSGHEEISETVTIPIPPGVDNEMRLRIEGKGDAGERGAPTGDLYIITAVASHKLFERKGNDLHCKIPIDIATAALGGDIEIPIIDGTRAKITIPNGTQHGHNLRCKSKGMPVLNAGGRQGDMIVQISLEIPRNLTDRQKEILVEFRLETQKTSSNHTPEATGFLDKMKDFFNTYNKS